MCLCSAHAARPLFAELSALCRAGCPRIVVAGSCAAMGSCAAIEDSSRFLPNNTYGMTKAVLEMLVNDYTRKGFLDGRTVTVPCPHASSMLQQGVAC